MADHIRKQIRDQIATELTGLTTTGSNVHKARLYPLNDSDLPAVNVVTAAETVSEHTMGADPVLIRELTLNLEGYVSVSTTAFDTLDTISKEIEVAMATDITHSGLTQDTTLISMSAALSGEGTQQVGVITLTYKITYFTAMSTPDIAI
jgi:hypothetical protein